MATTTAAADTRVAELVLPHYGFGPECTLRMINLSENATFLVEEGERSAILRVAERTAA